MSGKGTACPHCPQAFSRPSHLRRHVQSHMSPSERDLRSCHQCGRYFARNDVLIRHLRSFHGDQVRLTRAGRKSCARCIKKKIRCDRGQPCQHCVKGKSNCMYSEDTTPDTAVQRKDESGMRSSACPETEYSNSKQCEVGESSVENNKEAGMLQTTDPSSSYALDRWFDEQFTEPPPSPHADAVLAVGSTSFEALDDFTESITTEKCRTDILGPFLSPNANLELGCSDLDWLDVDFAQYDLDQWQIAPDSFSSNIMARPPQMLPVTAIQHCPTSVTYPTPHSSKTHEYAMCQIETGEKSAEICSNGHRIPAQPWPFDDDCQKPTLPPIESLVGRVARVHNTAAVSDRTQNARTAMEPNRQVLDAYFNHFHEILPLVHLPSFDPAQCPAILAAALSAIGAMFVREESSSKDSWPFSAAYLDLLSQWVSCHAPVSSGSAHADARLGVISLTRYYQFRSIPSLEAAWPFSAPAVSIRSSP